MILIYLIIWIGLMLLMWFAERSDHGGVDGKMGYAVIELFLFFFGLIGFLLIVLIRNWRPIWHFIGSW